MQKFENIPCPKMRGSIDSDSCDLGRNFPIAFNQKFLPEPSILFLGAIPCELSITIRQWTPFNTQRLFALIMIYLTDYACVCVQYAFTRSEKKLIYVEQPTKVKSVYTKASWVDWLEIERKPPCIIRLPQLPAFSCSYKAYLWCYKCFKK